MTKSRAEQLLRRPDAPPHATFLELLFDLAFVFAFSRVSDLLVAGLKAPGWTIDEAGKALLLLLALLMVWFTTAWLTDLYDAHRSEIQFVIAAAMFGTMLMALALSRAFGSEGLTFAVAYVGIHTVRYLVPLIGLRGHQARRRPAAAFLWFAASAPAWIVGALLHDLQRVVLWTLAVVIAYTGALLLWPAPWTASLRPRWPVAPEYMSERYRQFFIIALGELLLTAGLTYSVKFNRAPSGRWPFVLSFATVVLLWRLYTYPIGERLPTAIAAAPDPDRYLGRILIAHTLMVVAIVDIAAGAEFVIGTPRAHTTLDWVIVIIGGPALFLAGQAVLQHAVLASISRVRLTSLFVLVALTPVMFFLPLPAVAATATTVLAGTAVADAAVGHGHAATMPSPQQGEPQ